MKRAVSFIVLMAFILSLAVYIPFMPKVASETVKPEAVWASSYEEGYGGYPHHYATDGNTGSFWLSGSEPVKRIALKVYGGEVRGVQGITLTGYNCRYATSMKIYAFTEMPADWYTADYSVPAATVDTIPWAQAPQWEMNSENTAAITLASVLAAQYLVLEMYCALDPNQVSVGEIDLTLTDEIPKKAQALWASSYEAGYGGYPHPYATDGNTGSFWLSAYTSDAKRIALNVENGELRSITSVTFTGYNCRPVTSFKMYAFNELPADWATADYAAPIYRTDEVNWQTPIAWELNSNNTAVVPLQFPVKARYVVLELSCYMDPNQVSVGEITFGTADPTEDVQAIWASGIFDMSIFSVGNLTDGNPSTYWHSANGANVSRFALELANGNACNVDSVTLTGYMNWYPESVKIYAFDQPANWSAVEYTQPVVTADTLNWSEPPGGTSATNTAVVSFGKIISAKYLVVELIRPNAGENVSLGEITVSKVPLFTGPKAVWASSEYSHETYGTYPFSNATDGNPGSFWLTADGVQTGRIAICIDNGNEWKIDSIRFTGYNCRHAASVKAYFFDRSYTDWSSVNYAEMEYIEQTLTWNEAPSWTVNDANYATMTFPSGEIASYVVLEITGAYQDNLVSVGEITLEISSPDSFKTIFVMDEGAVTVTCRAGEAIQLPEVPKKDGMIFMGWYSEKTGGVEVTEFNGPQTVYARYATGYELNPDREIDNLEMFTAANSERSPSLVVEGSAPYKYFYVSRFGLNPSTDYIKWTVKSPLAAETDYFAWLNVNAAAGTGFKLEVKQDGTPVSSLSFTKSAGGWENLECGKITIPPGISSITLKLTTGSQNCYINGLNIIRNSDKQAYLDRISAYRASGNAQKVRFSNQDYGLFLQYGVWGFPKSGPSAGREESTNNFDVDNFINLLKDVRAKFVMWSLTWWQFSVQMPLESLDRIIGNSNYTTERDLIGEIAAKCQENGIDFYLYFNSGLGNGEWGAAQNYPYTVDFYQSGRGDKSTFIKNWIDVITEVGEKLGDKLDGWMFDDASVYYPAPFESMAAAAKAGNSSRIISYNAPVGIRPTDFEDFIFGENSWGDPQDTTDGILNSGGQKGLLQIGLPMLNTGGPSGGWGIVSENEPIGMSQSDELVISKVESAHQRKVPMALNVKMWEGGILSDDTIKQLFALRDARHPEMAGTEYLPKELEINAPYETISIFDQMQLSVSFKPQYTTNRSVTWTVTELDGSPTNKATISADGVLSGRGVLGKVKVRAQSKVNSSVYDDIIIEFDINLRRQIHPADTAITYQGTWHSGSFFRYTYNNPGSSATYTFFGHGIEWYGVTGSDHGMAAVYIDDELVQTVDCYTEDRFEDTLIFKIDNLPSGQHTIRIVSLEERNPQTTNTFVEIYRFIVERRVDVNSPFASPPPGHYRGEQEITLVTSRSNATIHYTLDGSEPNAQSPKYTAPIKLSQDTVIKAITLVNGQNPSEVSILEYLIDLGDPDETPLLDDATGISLYGITGTETPMDGYLHIRDITLNQSALNKIKALSGHMKVLKSFKISFLDARGKKDLGHITGPCILSIPVPNGKDHNTLAVYTVDNSGAATLLETYYDEDMNALTGYITDSTIAFALIEKIVKSDEDGKTGKDNNGGKTDNKPIIVPTVPEGEDNEPAEGILTLEEFKRIVGESESDIISLVVKQGTVFTADMQREIAGTGKTLQFKIRDDNGTIIGIWIFSDISDILEDIDLSLNIVSKNASVIEKLITNAESYIILSTAYHGQVHPGTILLVKNEKSMKKQDNLSLLFFDSEAEKLQKLDNKVVLTNDLSFIGSTFDHFSDYVIQKNKAADDKSPVQGDSSGFPWLVLWISAGVLIAGAAVVIAIVLKKIRKRGGNPSC